MDIKAFAVEEWMNRYELDAVYNIAETCCDSFTVEELIRIDGTDPDSFFRSVYDRKLTYGHIEGSPEFRNLVSGLYESIQPSQVLMMNGAIAANFLVFYSLIKPGDHVISVHPTYQQLYSIPESFGATVDLLRLKPENNFLPDIKDLKSLVNENTKLICINNPNNPSGSLMGADLLREVIEIARSVDAYILCDEVYRGLWQNDDTVIPSIVDLYEKGISTSSMSKVLSLAGLRLGWIAAPSEVIGECMRRRDYTTISCGMLDDMLACHALRNYDKVLERNRGLVKNNLRILDEWVESESKMSYIRPEAGTTALLKYDFSISSEQFCTELFKSTGTFLTPGSCFDMEGHVRIGYACDTETLENGLQKLSEYMESLTVFARQG